MIVKLSRFHVDRSCNELAIGAQKTFFIEEAFSKKKQTTDLPIAVAPIYQNDYQLENCGAFTSCPF